MTAGDVIVARGNLHARQGAAFDGTDDYILADAHAVARVGANDTVGTYSAWIYIDRITSDTFLSAGDNDSSNEYFHFHFNSGRLSASLKHGGATQWYVRETTASIPAKKWTHVAVVQNGIQPYLYINGLKVEATNVTATDLTFWYDELTGCDKFAIGVLESNNTHTNDFEGMISDVKYWDKALTAAEVLLDYQNTALDDDGTYLQLHLLKSNYGSFGHGVDDQGLGADDGTLTGHAYLTGWGSEHSRMLDNAGAVVADSMSTILDGNTAITTIVKAA